MTREQMETILIQKINAGLLDGQVGGEFPAQAATYRRQIKHGVPQHISIYHDGTISVDKEYKTDEEKLEFLRSAGWMMPDPDANLYSRLYRREKQ